MSQAPTIEELSSVTPETVYCKALAVVSKPGLGDSQTKVVEGEGEALAEQEPQLAA